MCVYGYWNVRSAPANQNSPTLTTVTGGPTTHVVGTLNSLVNSTLYIDFYASGNLVKDFDLYD